MPGKSQSKCTECQSPFSPSSPESGLCLECSESKTKNVLDNSNTMPIKEENNEDKPKEIQKETENDKLKLKEAINITADEKRLRKSTRATRFKAKSSLAVTSAVATNGNGNNGASTSGVNAKPQTKGRSRRHLTKKTPMKMPSIQATTHVVDNVFYNGFYFQVGDIVSLIDEKGDKYYAQIRALLVDNYCEKSAFLTWLLPTDESIEPNEGFDPPTYIIGPDEESPRKLSCLQFVMHAPSNYYFDPNTPFPLPDSMDNDVKSAGFIWTRM